MKSMPKMFGTAGPRIFNYARSLRGHETSAEIILWEQLKRKQFQGLKFRRQHPVSNFILDFYCHELKIAIELDGLHHNFHRQKLYDKKRSDQLKQLGIRCIRFYNQEVISELDDVLAGLNCFVERFIE